MKIFKELKKLGYIHYSANTIEELDDLPLNSAERVSEQALVLRWFREKYGLPSWVKEFNGARICYHFTINPRNGRSWDSLDNKLEFNTQEEAELACLIKLIEIVKLINESKK